MKKYFVLFACYYEKKRIFANSKENNNRQTSNLIAIERLLSVY